MSRTHGFSPLVLESHEDIDRNNITKLFFVHKIIVIRRRTFASCRDLRAIANFFGLVHSSNDTTYNSKDSFAANIGDSHLFEDEQNEVVRISNIRGPKNEITGALGDGFIDWHNDFSHIPGDFHGTLLYNKMAGALAATTFCDCQKLFEISNYKNELLGLVGRHSLRKSIEAFSPGYARLLKRRGLKIGRLPVSSTARSLVMRHPITGKNSYYLSPATLLPPEGVTDSIDNILEEVESNPSLCYKHKWGENDILLFDNLSLMHKRGPFSGERLLLRLQFNYANVKSLSSSLR